MEYTDARKGGRAVPVPIYVDILLCVNLYINYLLLQLTQKVLRRPFQKGRVVLASAAGAACSLLMLLPPLPGLLLFFLRLLLALAIVFLASGEKNFFYLIRQTLLFFGANVVLCGLVLLLWNLFLPNFMAVNNGVIYLNLSAVTLLVMTTVSYGLLRLLDRLRPKTEEKCLYRLRLYTEEGQVQLQGLLDSGNSLSDPFTGCPVAVMSYQAIQPILPESLRSILKKLAEEGVPPEQLPPCASLRWIPCSSVGASGLLPAFSPQKLECFRQGQWETAREVLVAVSYRPLSGEYEALLGPQICYDSPPLSPGARDGGAEAADSSRLLIWKGRRG